MLRFDSAAAAGCGADFAGILSLPADKAISGKERKGMVHRGSIFPDNDDTLCDELSPGQFNSSKCRNFCGIDCNVLA